MTHDERMKALVEAGEKASEWPVDVDIAAGNVLFLDTRHMAYVGVDDDGNPIADVDGGQEPLTDETAAYLLAAANARDTIALAAEGMRLIGEFMRHEAGLQARQDAGHLKDHVVTRLEILGRIDALLAKWNGKRGKLR